MSDIVEKLRLLVPSDSSGAAFDAVNEITALRAENERLKSSERSAWNAAVVRDEENERLRAALRGMIDNACAACDEDYVIRATKKEWDAHVNATAKARAALEEKP